MAGRYPGSGINSASFGFIRKFVSYKKSPDRQPGDFFGDFRADRFLGVILQAETLEKHPNVWDNRKAQKRPPAAGNHSAADGK